MPRATSNKPEWTDKQIARRATAVTVQAQINGWGGKAIAAGLNEEFTREEIERGLAYLQSGKPLSGGR
jgi:hypothetical protein